MTRDEPVEATLRNPHSTASIAGHPIHPMLIPCPIAGLIATLACDIVVWNTGSAGWATASTWILGASLVMAALAALTGFIDFMGDSAIRRLSHAWQHMIGNVIAVGLALVSFYLRYRYGTDGIVPWGLVASLIVVGILGFTGWRGGDLVYKEHVGVSDERHEEPATIRTPVR